jgi:uncharacterized protein
MISLRCRRCLAAFAAGVSLAGASPAAAEPALWRLRGAHATVYLFGTVHTLRADTAWHSPKIDEAFNSADTLCEEIANVGDQAAFQPLVAKYARDAMHPLSGKLDGSGKTKLLTVAAQLGVPAAQLEPLRPWFAAVQLSVLPLLRAGFDPNAGVDLKLRALAVEQRKTIAGFETLEQEMQTLSGLPEPVQVQFLLSTLDDAQKGAALLDQVVAAWSAGDVERLQGLLGGSVKLRYPELYKRLFVERNRAFAGRIEAVLKGKGTFFVAIGAAHLAGPDSVQTDLARDGFVATRI